MQCGSCSAEIDKNDRFCRSCGSPLPTVTTELDNLDKNLNDQNQHIDKPPRGLGIVGWLLMSLCIISMIGLLTSTIIDPTPPPRNYSSMAVGSAIIGGLVARYYRRSIILWSIISLIILGFLIPFIVGFIRAAVY